MAPSTRSQKARPASTDQSNPGQQASQQSIPQSSQETMRSSPARESSVAPPTRIDGGAIATGFPRNFPINDQNLLEQYQASSAKAQISSFCKFNVPRDARSWLLLTLIFLVVNYAHLPITVSDLALLADLLFRIQEGSCGLPASLRPFACNHLDQSEDASITQSLDLTVSNVTFGRFLRQWTNRGPLFDDLCALLGHHTKGALIAKQRCENCAKGSKKTLPFGSCRQVVINRVFQLKGSCTCCTFGGSDQKKACSLRSMLPNFLLDS